MSEFLNSESVFKTLGDFWYSHYDNKDQVRALVSALVEIEKQLDEDTSCFENSISRHTIQPYRKILWFPVHILESKFIEDSKRYVNYGETATYNDGAAYGVVTRKVFTVSIPEEIVEIGSVHDKIIEPEFSVSKPVIKDHKIELNINPFDTDSVYVELVYNEQGEAVDREAVLWLSDILVDREDLYNLYGYVLGIKLESSERYKLLINAIFNALINGPSKAVLAECMSALTGIPVVKEEREQVIKIEENKVYTDCNEYSFSPDDIITVSLGDVLSRGDTMTKGLIITENPSEIKGIQLVPSMTYLGMIDNLYISNQDEPLTIDDSSDKTIVTFPVYGKTSDVKLFNDAILKQGIKDCKEITDACELTEIKKILQLPNISTDDAQTTEEAILNAGMTTWVRTRRLN